MYTSENKVSRGILGHSVSHVKNREQRKVFALKSALIINIIMFLVEIIAGVSIMSVALKADSMDMLGDAMSYAISLYVLTQGLKMKACAALIKGSVMATFGLFVFVEAFHKIYEPSIPAYEVISSIGVMALFANALCCYLLVHHQNDDINMRSIWLCSRNDMIANFLVINAGLFVGISGSLWPDFVVGLLIALMFINTSLSIIRDSLKQLNR